MSLQNNRLCLFIPGSCFFYNNDIICLIPDIKKSPILCKLFKITAYPVKISRAVRNLAYLFKIIKYLEINLSKEVKDAHNKNFKTLKKETVKDA